MANANPQSNNAAKSRPYVLRQIHLGSTQAKQAYKRTFAQLSKATFNIGVITSVVLGDEAADRADSVVADHLNGLDQELTEEMKRLDQLMEDNGILDSAGYNQTEELEARVESPQAHQYLNLIKKADNLIAKLDALWISQIMDRKQKVDGAHHWKKRLQRVARQVIGLEQELRSEGRNQGKDADAEIEAAGSDVSQPGEEKVDEEEEAATASGGSGQPAAAAASPTG